MAGSNDKLNGCASDLLASNLPIDFVINDFSACSDFACVISIHGVMSFPIKWLRKSPPGWCELKLFNSKTNPKHAINFSPFSLLLSLKLFVVIGVVSFSCFFFSLSIVFINIES